MTGLFFKSKSVIGVIDVRRGLCSVKFDESFSSMKLRFKSPEKRITNPPERRIINVTFMEIRAAERPD